MINWFKRLICIHNFTKWQHPMNFWDFPDEGYRTCTKCENKQIKTTGYSGWQTIEWEEK